ncbi:MAG TPA: hypothetical protein VLM75_09820 [Spirochaetota bacterium]|nr:hypothetical protein [Spirochaetota bacterium]
MGVRKVGWGALVVVLSLAAAGCETSKVLIKDARVRNDSIEIAVESITDGPDRIQQAKGYLTPKAGKHLIWLRTKIKNASVQPLHYELYDIVLKNENSQGAAVFIEVGNFFNFASPSQRHNPLIKPQEVIHRTIVYVFPEGELPTKVIFPKVGEMDIVVTGKVE